MSAILVAPDKFKGSLDAPGVAAALAAGIAAAAPDREVRCRPVADGGEGTVAAALGAGWTPVPVAAHGPTGAPLTTGYARRGATALLEAATTAGLAALPVGPDGAPVLAPTDAGTEGLGVVVRHALEAGAEEIVIGLGGSATTDGGAGLLRALGAQILDGDGAPLPPGGSALLRAARIDLADLHPLARRARFSFACDVDNPLLGPEGAAAVYGPQKGADARQVRELDAALAHWVRVLADATGRDPDDLASRSGAGAAGGTACGIDAVLGAVRRSGARTVLDLVGFAAALEGVSLVVTGEGRLDTQTLRGKAPSMVAAAAAAAGARVVAVAGECLLTESQRRAAGFAEVHTLLELAPDRARAVADAATLLTRIGARIGARPDAGLNSVHTPSAPSAPDHPQEV